MNKSLGSNLLVPKSNYIRNELQMYPHIQDAKTKHDTRYDPDKYISVQTKVNNDTNFEKMYISKLINDGWVSLKNVSDILIFPRGRSFKYRLNSDSLSGVDEGTFRSGGWLIGRNLEDKDNDKYIMYKGYNGAIFSLQIKDLLEVYVKSSKKEIPVFKKPDINFKTKYPVFLPDPETGKNKIVYYAKDEFNRKRFTNSTKYKKALALNNWSWSIVYIN
jgi:hypothetical protein